MATGTNKPAVEPISLDDAARDLLRPGTLEREIFELVMQGNIKTGDIQVTLTLRLPTSVVLLLLVLATGAGGLAGLVAPFLQSRGALPGG